MTHQSQISQDLVSTSSPWAHRGTVEAYAGLRTPGTSSGFENESDQWQFSLSVTPTVAQGPFSGASLDMGNFYGPSMFPTSKPPKGSQSSRRTRQPRRRTPQSGVSSKANPMKSHKNKARKQVLLQIATLLRPVKQIIDNEIFHEMSHDQSSYESPALATTSGFFQGSTSTSEVTDSGYRTEETSISSTPRQKTYDALDSMSPDSHNKQLPMNHSGSTSFYPCSIMGCCQSFKTYSDWKRHEENHWPLVRFMCLDCIITQTDSNGYRVCGFCQATISPLSNTGEHYLQCTSSQEGAITFTRKYHLNKHLRDQHGMEAKAANQRSTDWHYPVSSDWPRQCEPCGITFRTWEERLKHIATKHYQKADYQPQGFHPSPKDDDSDRDDDSDENNGSMHKRSTECSGASGIMY